MLHAVRGDLGRLVDHDAARGEFGVGRVDVRTAEKEACVAVVTLVELLLAGGAFFVEFVAAVQHDFRRAQAEPAPVEAIGVATQVAGRLLCQS